MSLRHALILAINTSILAVLFAFTAWLYLSTRSEVEAQVAASLERAAAMSESLARLRERELANLAQSLAGSPMLQGAAATQDRETIEDVLRGLAAKNNLEVAALAKGGIVAYAARSQVRGARVKALGEGRFVGEAPSSSLALVLGQAPSRALLDSWSQITGVRYALREPAAADNIPEQEAALRGRRGGDREPVLVEGGQGLYYAREAMLLEGRLSADLYAAQEPFWRGFKSRRNSLAVLGGALFFLGLLLSLLLAGLIESHAGRAGPSAGSADWQRLLDEIERLRAGGR